MGYINDIPLSSDCNNGLNYHELQKNSLEKPDDDIKSISFINKDNSSNGYKR